MKFTIHKHVHRTNHGGGTWSIDKDTGTLSELCWEEMLGEVAMMLMAGRPHRFSATARSCSPLGSVYSLIVFECEPGWYTIRRGGRFIDRLACNEALGFIAAYTLTDGERSLFTGLQTYEEWVNHFDFRQRNIAALISYQPKLVA